MLRCRSLKREAQERQTLVVCDQVQICRRLKAANLRPRKLALAHHQLGPSQLPRRLIPRPRPHKIASSPPAGCALWNCRTGTASSWTPRA